MMNSNSTCRMYNGIDNRKRNCELRFGIVVRWMDLSYRQHTGMAWRVYNRSTRNRVKAKADFLTLRYGQHLLVRDTCFSQSPHLSNLLHESPVFDFAC